MKKPVTDQIHVHIPYRMLIRRLDEVLRAGLNPEIFLDGDALDGTSPDELKQVSGAFHERGRTITIHGPYMDLSPGGADEKVRRATVERYRQTFEAASYLKPGAIVLHGGWDERRFDGGPYDSPELALYWAMRESAIALGLDDFSQEIGERLGPLFE